MPDILSFPTLLMSGMNTRPTAAFSGCPNNFSGSLKPVLHVSGCLPIPQPSQRNNHTFHRSPNRQPARRKRRGQNRLATLTANGFGRRSQTRRRQPRRYFAAGRGNHRFQLLEKQPASPSRHYCYRILGEGAAGYSRQPEKLRTCIHYFHRQIL